MLFRSLGALVLMIAAVLVFISIQDPYVIDYKVSDISNKALEAKGLDAALIDKKAFISAEYYVKDESKDKLLNVRYQDSSISISAGNANKIGQMIELNNDVRILKDGMLILSEQADFRLDNKHINFKEPLVAYKDDNVLHANSAKIYDDKLELQGVRLCLEY